MIMLEREEQRVNLKIKLSQIQATKAENARNVNRNRIKTVEMLDEIKQQELLEKQAKALRERKVKEFQTEARLNM